MNPRKRRQREIHKKCIRRNNSWPNLGKGKETSRSRNQRKFQKLNPKKPKARHIIIQITSVKDKERILKAVREKHLVTYKVTIIKLTAGFSAKTLMARRERQDIFKVLKERSIQSKVLCLARLLFRIGEIISQTSKSWRSSSLLTRCYKQSWRSSLSEKKKRP